MVTSSVFSHPFASVPVTVYVVVEVGETECVAPEPNPLSQVYVEPPVAVSVVDAPLQIVTSVLAVIVGNGFTVTVT